ncbi:MerR family transcriptional regulator [Oscillochloris sp. ZM17-4]|uniref:MerR family transcriptional regulator n=1 Tax=Oscillochloris sp. ZM17-4 TaxID=2866714 RepID=UPI001C736D74|nr:B12-binding domain-containing protein [Oscillochloris sp. ZM17-4]MBX0327305.1 MerR family transcriptional regulator [Oscillochloris sp. ZM17-4]
MAQQHFLSQFSDKPRYNTKAVAQETGVPADTFRAWERRYGVPRPQRTEGGHRLYSERDIATIRWLRDRTAEGLTISQAIALMTDGAESNLGWLNTAVDTEPHTWDRLNSRLYAALVDFDATRAEQILGEAFAIYPLEDVFLKLVQPTMIEIGEQWHAGKISVTAEHFATQFIRRKLSGLFNTYNITDGRGLVMIGCAPGEQHDLGALMIAVFLVRHGWQVIYLGAEVPMRDLLDTVHQLQPDIVCMAASTTDTATQLMEVGRYIQAMDPPFPAFGYGGRAFNLNPLLTQKMPGTFLGRDAQEVVDSVADILSGR